MFATLASGCGSVREHAGVDGGTGGRTATGGASNGNTTSGGGRNAGGAGGAEPPAQAAVTFSVSPAPGKTCTHTNAELSFPSKYNASVQAELACDLSAGCKPDDYIAVDHDRGTTVACSVVATAGNYDVLLDLSVDGSETNEVSGQFGLSGTVTQAGGTVAVNESNSYANGGGRQSDCTVKIDSPHGIVKPGAIWGSVECSNFRDETDIGDTGCDLQGEFLFENCVSH